jgi:hypothetical protein
MIESYRGGSISLRQRYTVSLHEINLAGGLHPVGGSLYLHADEFSVLIEVEEDAWTAGIRALNGGVREEYPQNIPLSVVDDLHCLSPVSRLEAGIEVLREHRRIAAV